jgi:hypothetical protein
VHLDLGGEALGDLDDALELGVATMMIPSPTVVARQSRRADPTGSRSTSTTSGRTRQAADRVRTPP